MKLLQIYNQYRSLFNGEETVVFRTAEMMEQRGHTTRLLMRSSRDITGGWWGKAWAFCSGIYNYRAAVEVARLLRDYQPDLVHVHNVYPLFSPSVLAACRQAGVPVVMSLHNQNLTCPRADHLYRGSICERCFGGGEYHCVLRNCRQNLLESVGYAVRSAVARQFGLFRRNVTVFIALTEFARRRLVRIGFDPEQICVLPNMAPDPDSLADPARGDYVAFAGRLSEEKGLEVLLAAAAQAPEVPFRLAGGGPMYERLVRERPDNVELVGQLDRPAMNEFYRGARMLVLPSTTYEMSPLVIAEAMSLGLPVVASRLGGIPELVDDQRTGLLFTAGHAGDLAKCLRTLWHDPERCAVLGQCGAEKARREYSEQAYYDRLMTIYKIASERSGRSLPGDVALENSLEAACHD